MNVLPAPGNGFELPGGDEVEVEHPLKTIADAAKNKTPKIKKFRFIIILNRKLPISNDAAALVFLEYRY